jgi:hypothetical protein
MAKKSNTTKYLLIAGVAAVGYYFYSKSQAPAAAAVNPNDLAAVTSWAQGLDAHNKPLFLAALPSFTADQVANMKALINSWNGVTPLTDQMINYWVNFSSGLGLT